MSVLVVGGGVAGAAAVHQLTRSGVPCSWLLGQSGASSASSGALDWDLGGEAPSGGEPTPELSTLARRFGWSLPEAGAVLVTSDGALRRANGSDGALLDLARYTGSVVAVLDWPRWGWDAPRCCRALAQQTWAVETRTRFVPLSPDPTDLNGFLALEDDACARALQAHAALVVARCRAKLSELEPQPAALLVGPWLLRDASQTGFWAEALGVPLGETLSPPYGLAGVRFEAVRDALAQSSGVERLDGLLQRLEVEPGCVRVELAGQSRSFDACVLATGGLVGGGFELDAENRWRTSFELVSELPLSLDGKLWLPPASRRGLDVQSLGVEALGRIGFSGRQVPGARLFVAGDALAARSRTLLRAAQSGLDAGARVALSCPTGSRAGSAAASAERGTVGS